MVLRNKEEEESMLRRSKLILPLLVVVLIVVACASQDAAVRIAAFSEATTVTIQNTATAFDMVEQNYYQMQVSRMVAKYDQLGFNPLSIERFLDPEDLEARLLVLRGLQQYSEKLAMVMGNEQLTEFDEETRELGASLATLNEDIVEHKILSKSVVDAGQIKIFTTAVNALGTWFIEYKRQKGAKKIIAEMDKRVGDISDMLIQDVGSSPAESGGRATGLRAQLWNQYNESMRLQDKFIRDNKDRLDPISRRNEIKQLAYLFSQQKQADATLKSIQSAIGKLRETHGKLHEAFGKNTIEVDNLIAQLKSEGRRISEYYKSLSF